MTGPDKEIRVRVAGLMMRENKILLVSHEKDGRVYWLLPGGGVEYGEPLDAALKREFLEEVNLSVEVKDCIYVNDSIDPSGGRHLVNIVFLCEYLEGVPAIGEERRLHELGFFTKDELASMELHPPIQEDLVNYMEGNPSRLYGGALWKQ